MSTSKTMEPKLVEVTLTGEHTHKGKPCKKGDKINVTQRQRVWLIEIGKVAGKAADK